MHATGNFYFLRVRAVISIDFISVEFTFVGLALFGDVDVEHCDKPDM